MAEPDKSGLVPGEQEKKAGVYFDQQQNTVVIASALAAKMMGVTQATLSNWVKDGCPRFGYGWYDVKALLEYKARKDGVTAGDEETDPEQMGLKQKKLYQEARLKEAQAEDALLKNQLNRGELLERETVIRELKQFAVVLKSSLQGLGKQLAQDVASQISADEARRFDRQITDTVNDALEQLAVEGVYRYERRR